MMDKRTYSFAVGIILIIVSLAFFILPSLLDLDYFILFMLALVSFILGLSSFYKGYSEK
jgi:O-antigen/teichoic acid export membrane protein